MAECIYLISAPTGMYINITVLEMDIICQEMFSTKDFIEFRDGFTENSTLMGTFCGNASNVPALMQTTKNYLRIR